eukprot:TRINITY_DN4987_c0_g1_i1.p1 TRINITY_DN4987_c0_g1~~TRINITY_DN4987_c0_g1_i1.p1  ORF type:complete len:856 (-),score=45.76 TRINITY_DN4987_c0_g1_i1:33-2600(-)
MKKPTAAIAALLFSGSSSTSPVPTSVAVDIAIPGPTQNGGIAVPTPTVGFKPSTSFHGQAEDKVEVLTLLGNVSCGFDGTRIPFFIVNGEKQNWRSDQGGGVGVNLFGFENYELTIAPSQIRDDFVLQCSIEGTSPQEGISAASLSLKSESRTVAPPVAEDLWTEWTSKWTRQPIRQAIVLGPQDTKTSDMNVAFTSHSFGADFPKPSVGLLTLTGESRPKPPAEVDVSDGYSLNVTSRAPQADTIRGVWGNGIDKTGTISIDASVNKLSNEVSLKDLTYATFDAITLRDLGFGLDIKEDQRTLFYTLSNGVQVEPDSVDQPLLDNAEKVTFELSLSPTDDSSEVTASCIITDGVKEIAIIEPNVRIPLSTIRPESRLLSNFLGNKELERVQFSPKVFSSNVDGNLVGSVIFHADYRKGGQRYEAELGYSLLGGSSSHTLTVSGDRVSVATRPEFKKIGEDYVMALNMDNQTPDSVETSELVVPWTSSIQEPFRYTNKFTFDSVGWEGLQSAYSAGQFGKCGFERRQNGKMVLFFKVPNHSPMPEPNGGSISEVPWIEVPKGSVSTIDANGVQTLHSVDEQILASADTIIDVLRQRIAYGFSLTCKIGSTTVGAYRFRSDIHKLGDLKSVVNINKAAVESMTNESWSWTANAKVNDKEASAGLITGELNNNDRVHVSTESSSSKKASRGVKVIVSSLTEPQPERVGEDNPLEGKVEEDKDLEDKVEEDEDLEDKDDGHDQGEEDENGNGEKEPCSKCHVTIVRSVLPTAPLTTVTVTVTEKPTMTNSLSDSEISSRATTTRTSDTQVAMVTDGPQPANEDGESSGSGSDQGAQGSGAGVLGMSLACLLLCLSLFV